MGDLVPICAGDLSCDRRLGLARGLGRRLEDVLGDFGEVAEAVTQLLTRQLRGERDWSNPQTVRMET